jgi:PD-(D/E)XK nuclease superfamily
VQNSNTNGFAPLRSIDEIRAQILESAQRFRSEIQSLDTRSLPDWWMSGWSNALYLADCLATKLSDLGDWSHMAAEFSLGSPATISLAPDETLRVRGRIDLILARDPLRASPIGYSDLWVIDYKTGRQRGFKLRELRKHESPEEKMRKQLVDGRGVQLALYALAVNALGASHVRLTLLAPVGELEPQFHLEHVLAQKEIWRELHRMQESGVFGMLGKVHADYGAVRTYPLATLAIDPDLLREKWSMTHPALTQQEEDNGET